MSRLNLEPLLNLPDGSYLLFSTTLLTDKKKWFNGRLGHQWDRVTIEQGGTQSCDEEEVRVGGSCGLHEKLDFKAQWIFRGCSPV